MIHDDILSDLRESNPAAGRAFRELGEMASASPEAAIDLILELAGTALEPVQRGWLAIGPLRTALSSANEVEEEELEARAESDPTLSAMLEALIRYEQKQLAAASLLESGEAAGDIPGPADEIVIPNVHDRSAETALDDEAWGKVVEAIESAPEGQLFMLASTILETLLLQNESSFRNAILVQVKTNARFRQALSYCELSFSEPFLDELIGVLKSEG